MKTKISLLIISVVLCITAYSFFIEPFLVKMNYIELGDENKKETLKVVQLSDIQLSESYKEDRLDKIVKKVNK